MVSPSPRDEARINDALKKLCEEFHLGMVQAEEYRSRRRLLLETWADRDITTSPGIRSRVAQGAAPASPKAPPAPPPAGAGKKNLVIGAAILVAIVIAVIVVMMLRKPATHAQASPVGAASGAAINREHLAQIRQAAVDFVARNQWEPPNLDGFLARWRELSPAEQALARQEPSLRSLRYELQQNIQLAAQMAGAEADAALKQRLERLSGFARELEGPAP